MSLPRGIKSVVRDPASRGVLIELPSGQTMYRSEQWLADYAISIAGNLVDGTGSESDAEHWQLICLILDEDELNAVDAVVKWASDEEAKLRATSLLHLRLPDGVVACQRTSSKFQVPELRPSDAFDCPACGEHVRPSTVLS